MGLLNLILVSFVPSRLKDRCAAAAAFSQSVSQSGGSCKSTVTSRRRRRRAGGASCSAAAAPSAGEFACAKRPRDVAAPRTNDQPVSQPAALRGVTVNLAATYFFVVL